jgi:SAM-dependent methyltransferase
MTPIPPRCKFTTLGLPDGAEHEPSAPLWVTLCAVDSNDPSRSGCETASTSPRAKPRLLVVIVADLAERTIDEVLRWISGLENEFHVEVLIDDGSADQSFRVRLDALATRVLPVEVRVFQNPVCQGYGEHQKIGFRFAIENQFDYVVLLRGDAPYTPECLSAVIQPLRDGAALSLGSRALQPMGANRILTWLQNQLLGTNLSDFDSGCRGYAVSALRQIPFERNTNDFHFDTEVIIQIWLAGLRVCEVPIPTESWDKHYHVNGFWYWWNALKSVIRARAQDLSLFYDRRFDCKPDEVRYPLKLNCKSSHSMALENIPEGSRVVDLGCGDASFAAIVRSQRRCQVIGVDRQNPSCPANLDGFVQCHLDSGALPDCFENKDTILLLDVIEHLHSPEDFLVRLRETLKHSPDVKIIATTGNVGFFVTRVMLLLGQFNYGKRGILDLDHKRLFTFGSFRLLFEQAGYRISAVKGIPAPFILAVGDNLLGRALGQLNSALIHLSKGLFAYQIFLELAPAPPPAQLLTWPRSATGSGRGT